MTTEQKLKLAKRAITTVLVRVQRDKDVRHLIGVGSKSFDELSAALAALDDKPVNEVRELVIPGSSDIHNSTPESLIES